MTRWLVRIALAVACLAWLWFAFVNGYLDHTQDRDRCQGAGGTYVNVGFRSYECIQVDPHTALDREDP